MSWTNLEDKVIIVTGGAAGIGLAVVKGCLLYTSDAADD